MEYYFEERADAAYFESYPNNNETVWAIKYELNSDGEIAEESIEIIKKTVQNTQAEPATGRESQTDVTKRADRKYVEMAATRTI